MAVFAIIRASEHPQLERRIQEKFPARYHIVPGQWFVRADMTARQVSDELGLKPGGEISGVLVLRVSSYYGLHSNDLWEWLKTAMEQTENV